MQGRMHALSQGTKDDGEGGENGKLQGKRWRKAGGRTLRACGLFSRKSQSRTRQHGPSIISLGVPELRG